MRILLTGASGFIGSRLGPTLEAQGHEVARLVRGAPSRISDIQWEVNTPPRLPDCEAVIHLAGESIMGRWTEEKKRRILESRKVGTGNLALALARMPAPPLVFIVASAVGYYGPQGDELITEDSPPGSDFLAHVCQVWEASAEPARAAGIRTVHLRIGFVLSPEGGGLKQMLTPFRLGLGGRLGNGQQWISWVALEDVLQAVPFVLERSSVSGPVNVVAPSPVRNVEFTKALGKALHRPAIFPMPAAAAKLAFGEVAVPLLLSGQRVAPSRLQSAGYRFRHENIQAALHSMLE